MAVRLFRRGDTSHLTITNVLCVLEEGFYTLIVVVAV